MAEENFKRDDNYVPVAGAVSGDSSQETRQLKVDPITDRLLVETVGDNLGSPNSPAIYNVFISNPDQEYSQQLPTNTKQYKIYAVDVNRQNVHGDVLKYCFVEGESNSTFIAIPPAGYDQQTGLDFTGTLYMQSPTGSAYTIIMAWY